MKSTNERQFLCAGNFRLPASDYRLCHGLASTRVNVAFALPDKPPALPDARYYCLKVGEGMRPAYLVALLRFLVFLRRNRHRLTGVHFYSSMLFTLGPLLARLARVPCIITVTGFGRALSDPRLRVFTFVFWILVRHSLRHSRAVLFQNRHDLKLMAQRYPRCARKLHLIGSAARFPTHQRSFDVSVAGVLLVSRLAPAKGVEDFLVVARALASPSLRFTLVGSALGCSQDLRSAVDQAHAEGIIDYRGRLDGKALEQVFADQHFFLFPSRAEGMSRVMIEAGLSGLCPVAYAIPANLEVVPARSENLVPCFDLDALTAQLHRLVRDPDLAARSAAIFHEHVQANFDMDSFIRRMDDLLTNLGFATANKVPA